MNGGPGLLERAIEVALTIGVVASGVLLLTGLLLGATAPLKWGIELLMLTPVARIVVVTLGLFLRRDWTFALVSLWVLGVILSGMYVAARL